MESTENDRDSITLADLLGLQDPVKSTGTKSKKKKTKIDRFYSEEQIQMALYDIEKGTLSLRKAALKYNVPRSTLVFRRGPKFKKVEKGPRPILSREEEEELAMWILQGETYGAPRRYSHIQEWVQKLLNDHPRDNVPFADNKPGRGWMKNFLRRHPELDAMKNTSFDGHCEIAKANVKQVATEDLSTKPADISQSLPNSELVDSEDVASQRRTRTARQKKTPVGWFGSIQEFKGPLTADAVGDEVDVSTVKVEMMDPAYEQAAGQSSQADQLSSESKDSSSEHHKRSYELQDSSISAGPLTPEDLQILSESADEDAVFDTGSSPQPTVKRIKVEEIDYRCGSPDSALSFCSNRTDDVEFVSQPASSVKLKSTSRQPPPLKGKPATGRRKRRDNSDIFGEYVAAKLRSLNTDAARNRAECLIANILFEAGKGRFDSYEPTHDVSGELQAYLSSTVGVGGLKRETSVDDDPADGPGGSSMDLRLL